MAEDKHAQERLAFNREIAQQENLQDELQLEEKRLRQQVEHFQDQMNSLFRQEEDCYYDMQEKGVSSANQEFALHEIKKEVSRLTDNQNELLSSGYRLEKNTIQATIEELQKERNALAWD